MKIIRETALEIFGLKENFSAEELKKAYRRLSKVTHPDNDGDENLFRLIGCCKEILENPAKGEEEQTTKKSNNDYKKPKTVYYITLSDLYKAYKEWYFNAKIQNVDIVLAKIHLDIYPLFKKSEKQSIPLELKENMSDFKKQGFVHFSETVVIPEELKKYRIFIANVQFMEREYQFFIYRRQPDGVFYYIENLWHSDTFKTTVHLNFKF